MAAIVLRNPKTHLSRNLIRLFSTSSVATQDRPAISSFRIAKRSIRNEFEPEKLAETFLQTTDHPRSYRDRSLFVMSVKKLAKLQRLDLVEKILEKHKETDLLKTEGFWIRIIMLYSDVGMLDQAIRTFEQMEEVKCERSEKSFCALLTACLENGKFDLVHKYFESIPSKIGISPGVVAHNLAIRAFIAKKALDSARALFDKMEKTEVSSYNAMLTGYLNNGEDAKFNELYKEFMNKGLEPNLVSYNLRISYLCKNKECIRAEKLLDEMISKGVKPNVNSFNILIDGFCKIADFEYAKCVFERMSFDDDESVSPNSESYGTMIQYLVKEMEFVSALKMCKESLKRKWVPAFSTMERLVKGLVKHGKENEAKEIVANMKKMLRGTANDAWTKVESRLSLQ